MADLERGTPIVFQESGGNAVITLLNMLTGVARISERYDLGSGPTPRRFQWRATFQMDTTPVLNESIDLYTAESDGTLEDGDVGTADAALSTDVLPNLHYIGSVLIQVATATVDQRASGIFTVTSRYFSLGVHNATTDSLESTANVNTITITPFVGD